MICFDPSPHIAMISNSMDVHALQGDQQMITLPPIPNASKELRNHVVFRKSTNITTSEDG